MKGDFIMNKTIITICLMAGAVFASFAGVQYNNLGLGSNGYGMGCTFTFTSDGSYGLLFGSDTDYFHPGAGVTAFGYYFLDDPANWISGTLSGNTSDYFSGHPELSMGTTIDTNTGLLGNFNAGDTIGIWIQVGGLITTSTDTGLGYAYCIYNHGIEGDKILALGPSLFFQFAEMNTPAGVPLPGVMIELAIGGCVFLGRKLSHKINK